MKIAVSANGTGLDSNIDPRFGRASYFVLVDSESRQITDVIDNRAAQEAAHGAGINAATMVAGSGAKVVLTGRVGPKAYAVLNAGNVEIVSGAEGSVKEAVDAFLSGSLDNPSPAGPTAYAHGGLQGLYQQPRTAGGGGGGRRGGGGGAGTGGGRGCGGGGGRGMGGGRGQGRGGCGCNS